jgi:CRP/FNR family transcriptional regulator, dissimilatory nitrate respiration regulator
MSATTDDLKAAPLFSRLADDQLAELAAIAHPVRLPAGRPIFWQGEPAQAYYLLTSGSVKVYKALRDGRTASLRHVRPGETFGESVLFTERYPASTETLTECALYRFDVAEFRALLTTGPEIAIGLLGAMANLMVMLNQRVEELLLPVPARLARYLGDLAARQGDDVTLPTSKQELAARLGTVPETLSRTLNRFARGGVVTVDGNHIKVCNRAALERLAQQPGA